MSLTSYKRIEPAARELRLQTLVRLRWLAVAGQLATVLFVSFVLDFELPLAYCLALIALSAWLNMFLQLRYPASRRISARYAVVLLAYDTAQLGGLLYLTGGLENPFVFLLLAPVVVSATALPLRYTLALAAMVVILATLLGFVHLQLPWREGTQIALPLVYRAGMWVALLASLIFMTIYAWRIAEEARQMTNALAATERVLAREQHLSALDGLAAAAAHELGTPLATISLVTKELLRDAEALQGHSDDLALLQVQADRCRDILAKLTSLGDEGDAMLARMPLAQLIEGVVAPYRHFDKAIEIAIDAADGGGEPVLARNPSVLYGLGNLVENAVDFAADTVNISAIWNKAGLIIEIGDDGPGISPDMLGRLGEPYVTTRKALEQDGRPEGSGLGLGYFIAKTLLERSGARTIIRNRPAPRHGAIVTISWPRDALV